MALISLKVKSKSKNRFLVVGLNTLFCSDFFTGPIVKQVSTLNCYSV